MKKDGQIVSYKVLQTEAHGSTDWNLMLMTEYRDLAASEKSLEKTDALLQTLFGDDEKQRQGYRERLAIREVLADRLARAAWARFGWPKTRGLTAKPLSKSSTPRLHMKSEDERK